MPSGHDLQPERLALFLLKLSQNGNVSKSSELAEVSRKAVYNHRRDDPEFAAAWNEAQELGTDALEDEATRRAYDGVEEDVYYQGVVCGTVRKYSDGLLTFLLKARRPERFKERSYSEHAGPNGAPLAPPNITVTLVSPRTGTAES